MSFHFIFIGAPVLQDCFVFNMMHRGRFYSSENVDVVKHKAYGWDDQEDKGGRDHWLYQPTIAQPPRVTADLSGDERLIHIPKRTFNDQNTKGDEE